MENFELYLIVIIILLLVGLIINTFTYHKGKKRKIKNLHRFANDGEIEAQEDLAKHYEKGDMVKKDKDKADFWHQRASFTSDKIARETRSNIPHSKTNQKK
jgi:hypothetical protein